MKIESKNYKEWPIRKCVSISLRSPNVPPTATRSSAPFHQRPADDRCACTACAFSMSGCFIPTTNTRLIIPPIRRDTVGLSHTKRVVKTVLCSFSRRRITLRQYPYYRPNAVHDLNVKKQGMSKHRLVHESVRTPSVTRYQRLTPRIKT